MNRRLYLCMSFLVVGAVLQGCATTSLSTMNRQVLAAKAPEQQTEDLATEYNRVMLICENRMNDLSGDVSEANRFELGLAAVGIIAGSIVVPALAAKATAAKSAVAAWGGVSGAANAGQLAFSQKGASTVTRAARYTALRTEIIEYTDTYSRARTPGGRLRAINRLAVACTFAPLPEFTAPTPQTVPDE